MFSILWKNILLRTTTVLVFIAADATKRPFTGLHCEATANVAVQLWGSRTWTLVDTKHS
jgi:hypothetical protein